MRNISLQASRELEPTVEDWMAKLIAAMPVLPNHGIKFDLKDGGRKFTVVNRRHFDSWTVSFRIGDGNGDLRHYPDGASAARAVIDGYHNLQGQRP